MNQAAELKSVQANPHCTIRDISPDGALIELSSAPEFWIGSFIILQMQEFGIIASEVRHIANSLRRCGLKFVHDTDGQSQLAEFLRTMSPEAAGRQA